MPDYFTVAELRAMPHVGDTSKYPDALVTSTAAEIEAIIDSEVFGPSGVGFVDRTFVERVDGNGRPELLLATEYVRSLTTVTVGGASVDVSTLTAQHGILRRTSSALPWPLGVENVVVTYEAGYGAAVPADIKAAAMRGTRYRLLATAQNSELNARQTSITNDVGGTISFAVAGPDHPTGYPDVDATIVRWRDRMVVGGFA